MLDLGEVESLLRKLFSENGYRVDNVTAFLPNGTKAEIVKDEKKETLEINFLNNNLPKVQWRKIILFTAYVVGVSLKKEEAVIRIKYFPDVVIKYKKEKTFGMSGLKNKEYENNLKYNVSDIKTEISKEYADAARKNLANQCLQYGVEWAKIVNGDSLVESSFEKPSKKDCKNFIRENLKNSNSNYGSPLLTFILLYILLPTILKFVVEKIFKKFFN